MGWLYSLCNNKQVPEVTQAYSCVIIPMIHNFPALVPNATFLCCQFITAIHHTPDV
jgi:hypothetical protein